MIHLVLDGARHVTFRLEFERPAKLVEGLDSELERAAYLLIDSGNREAAFLARLRARTPDDYRIHQGVPSALLVVERDVHYQRALEHADLIRGQADAVVNLHGLAQVRDQRTQRLVELHHLGGPLPQHRVAVDADRPHGHYFASPART